MGSGAKRVARMALLTALGAALLLIAGLLPAGRIGVLLIASLPVCAALMMYGPGWAAGVFAVTAALGFLMGASAGIAPAYAAFFGYYPIAKSLIERVHGRWQPWGLKLTLYSIVFAAAYKLLKGLFLAGSAALLPWYVLFLIGAAAFLVYDWCYSLVIRFYLEKIARYIA